MRTSFLSNVVLWQYFYVCMYVCMYVFINCRADQVQREAGHIGLYWYFRTSRKFACSILYEIVKGKKKGKVVPVLN
jgi:hypothetical protein